MRANTPLSLLPCPWHAAGNVPRYAAGSVARPRLLRVSRIQCSTVCPRHSQKLSSFCVPTTAPTVDVAHVNACTSLVSKERHRRARGLSPLLSCRHVPGSSGHLTTTESLIPEPPPEHYSLARAFLSSPRAHSSPRRTPKHMLSCADRSSCSAPAFRRAEVAAQRRRRPESGLSRKCRRG